MACATGRPDMAWRGPVCAGLLALVWISTQPFRAGTGTDVSMDSNIVNQIVFSLAAVLAVGSVMMAQQRVLAAYLRPSYGLMLGWILFSVLASTNVDVSLRASAFTCVVLVIAASAMVLPVSQRQFALMIGLAALAVVILCYLGLVAFPDAAMHSGEDMAEPEHAGSWRGLFDHKNIAGAMMSFFAMIGLYVARIRSRLLGWSLCALSVLFRWSCCWPCGRSMSAIQPGAPSSAWRRWACC